jgi:hypothetical protein
VSHIAAQLIYNITAPEHDSRAMQYCHHELRVVKNPAGKRNLLQVVVKLVFTKTEEGRGRKYALNETMGEQSLCWNGPMLFVAMMLMDQATTEVSKIDDLLDPSFLGGRGVRIIKFKDEW